jgi:hypothetical protein
MSTVPQYVGKQYLHSSEEWSSYQCSAAHRIDDDGNDRGPPKKKIKCDHKAGGKGPKDKNFSKYKPKKLLTGRSYSNNKWKATDIDEKVEVKVLCDAKKSNTTDGHRASSVTSVTCDEPPEEEEEETTEKKDKGISGKGRNAGNQFGCWAHVLEEKPGEDKLYETRRPLLEKE